MRLLAGLALLLCVASCNAILGIKDLSETEPDGGGGDAGLDGASGNPSIRFLLVTPDIFRLDPDGMASIRLVGGAELAQAQYGVATPFVDLPPNTTSLEIRRGDGELVLATTLVIYDRPPSTAGERITAVIAGTLQPTAGEEPAGALAFSELAFDQIAQPEWRLVNGVTDRADEPLNYSLSYPSGIIAPQPLGPVLSTVTPDPLEEGVAFRLRVGLGLTQAQGTEDCSFSVPPQSANAKMLFVLGGLLHADADAASGLRLYLVPFDDEPTMIRQDPAFYVVNFYQDYANDTMWLADANDSSVSLSRQSNQRTEPMTVFGRPLVAQDVRVQGLAGTATFTLPPTAAGSRIFLALRGFIDGGTPVPSITTVTPDGEPPTSMTQVAFLHASVDPAVVDVTATDINTLVEATIASGLTYGSVGMNEVESSVQDVQVFPPGNTTAISTFRTEIIGSRQLLVLHGKRNPAGAEESLRLSAIDMRAWPWQVATAIVGQ